MIFYLTMTIPTTISRTPKTIKIYRKTIALKKLTTTTIRNKKTIPTTISRIEMSRRNKASSPHLPISNHLLALSNPVEKLLLLTKQNQFKQLGSKNLTRTRTNSDSQIVNLRVKTHPVIHLILEIKTKHSLNTKINSTILMIMAMLARITILTATMNRNMKTSTNNLLMIMTIMRMLTIMIM